MARASGTAEQAALNGLDATQATNVIAYVSLHTADPGTAGSSENAATGGYARQACTWNSATTSGAKTNSSALTFSTAGTVAVTYFGTASASTGSNYAIGGALGSSVTAASITVSAGALTLSAS